MITPRHIKDGMVALWELHEGEYRKVKLATVDAAHALQADPDRWSLPDHPDAPPPIKADPELEPGDPNLRLVSDQTDKREE